MTLVLTGKDLVLEGSNTKKRGHSQVPGAYYHILELFIFLLFES